MQPDPERYLLSLENRRQIFERRIKPSLLHGIPAVFPHPSAIVFGGQPGSGKSMAMLRAVQDLGGASAVASISGDDFRGHHPMFAPLLASNDTLAAFYTDRDSGAWVEMAIEAAMQHRVPLVIEGTMRSADKVAATLAALRKAGYRTEARALAVPHALSWQAVLARYHTQRSERGWGRMTTPEAHQAAFDGLPVTLDRIEQERLADRVRIDRRDGQCLYWHDLASGTKSAPTSARAAVEEFRAAPLSLVDRKKFEADWASLEKVVRALARHPEADHLQQVIGLRNSARQATVAEALRTLPKQSALTEFPELQEAYKALETFANRIPQATQPELRAQAVKEAKERLASHIEAGRPASLGNTVTGKLSTTRVRR